MKLLDYGCILHKKYTLNEGNSIIGIHESEILKVNKIIEIRRLLDIAYNISFYSKLSINFWKKFDYKKDMDKFFISDDFILVNNLVNDKYDKYYLFALLYPEKFQKRYIKSKYGKVTNNIIRLQ